MITDMRPYNTSEELLRQILPAVLRQGVQDGDRILAAMTESVYTLLLYTPRLLREQTQEEQLIASIQQSLSGCKNLFLFNFRERHMGFVVYDSGDWDQIRRDTLALESELERFFSGLRQETGVVVNLSVGRPFRGLLHLQDAYSELINSTLTFSIRPDQLVVSEYDIVNDPALLGEPYPQSEIERRLVDNILSLEIRKAHAVMEEIIRFERSSLQMNLSFLPRMAKRVEWILIVLHVPRNSGYTRGAEIYSYPYRIQYAEGNDAGEALVHEFFDKLEDYYQAFRFNVGKDISQITGFIQDHYADINLDATMICDRFRISPSYLSHTFKKRTGMRLLDYIHGVRIARAKELLNSTSLSIREIGSAVGYVSSASFSTTFKKYESVTPREYREAARNRNS